MISEIDHIKPWAQGGPTDHDNLEHFCKRHHMFKTKGFWKAKQSSPGVIAWTPPGGRCYRTEPGLILAPDTFGHDARQLRPDTLGKDAAKAQPEIDVTGVSGDPDGNGDDPPPF